MNKALYVTEDNCLSAIVEIIAGLRLIGVYSCDQRGLLGGKKKLPPCFIAENFIIRGDDFGFKPKCDELQEVDVNGNRLYPVFNDVQLHLVDPKQRYTELPSVINIALFDYERTWCTRCLFEKYNCGWPGSYNCDRRKLYEDLTQRQKDRADKILEREKKLND